MLVVLRRGREEERERERERRASITYQNVLGTGARPKNRI
jgi:hypothetical protein